MKTKKYDYIEYTDDHDFVIANVVMDGEKIVSVKLTEDCFTNKEDLTELELFLNTIKSMPWKYDDTDQECVGWFKGQTEVPIMPDITKMTMTA